MTDNEYIGLFMGVFGSVAGIAGLLFWRMITRMENKIDNWIEIHTQCREQQLKEFVSKQDYIRDWDNWRPGRDLLWEAFNEHEHDKECGRVVRKPRRV